MPSRSSALCGLSLLSCSLTFMASGDDFCLPRLLFSTGCSSSGRLPLDDPNTDFLDATFSCRAHRSMADIRHDHHLAIAGPVDFPSPAAPLFPSLAPDQPTHCLPVAEQTFPLRC